MDLWEGVFVRGAIAWIIQLVTQLYKLYSGTSNKGHSEEGQTFIQGTNQVCTLP